MIILIVSKPSILASAAVTIVSDVAVTVTVVYSLRKERVHFQRLLFTVILCAPSENTDACLFRTQGIINWLVLYCVSTGGLLMCVDGVNPRLLLTLLSSLELYASQF